MIIGISVDIDQLDRYYNIIARNLDIIDHIQFYLDESPLYLQKQEIIKFKTLFDKSKLTYSLHSYGYINLCETIDAEDKEKPYTDDELADILKAKGYPIARRTVAKYRQQLNIPVARLRR